MALGQTLHRRRRQIEVRLRFRTNLWDRPPEFLDANRPFQQAMLNIDQSPAVTIGIRPDGDESASHNSIPLQP